MMEIKEIEALKAAVREHRTVTELVAGRQFALLIPTPHEIKIEVLTQFGALGDLRAALPAAYRNLVERAVTGWSEVVKSDLVPGASNEPLPWAAPLVPLLLDAHPDWEEALIDAVKTRTQKRVAFFEEAEKN